MNIIKIFFVITLNLKVKLLKQLVTSDRSQSRNADAKDAALLLSTSQKQIQAIYFNDFSQFLILLKFISKERGKIKLFPC